MSKKISYDNILESMIIPSHNIETLAIAIEDYKNDGVDYIELQYSKNLPKVTMYPNGSKIEKYEKGDLIIQSENDYSHICHTLRLKDKNDDVHEIVEGQNFKMFMLNFLLGNFDKIDIRDYYILKSLGIIHLAENPILDYCIHRNGLNIYDIDKVLCKLDKDKIKIPYNIEDKYKLYLIDIFKLDSQYKRLDIINTLNALIQGV